MQTADVAPQSDFVSLIFFSNRGNAQKRRQPLEIALRSKGLNHGNCTQQRRPISMQEPFGSNRADKKAAEPLPKSEPDHLARTLWFTFLSASGVYHFGAAAC